MEQKQSLSGRQLIAHFRDATRPCVIISHKRKVLFANEAAAKQIGLDLQQLIGLELAGTHSGTILNATERPPFVAELYSWSGGTSLFENGGSELLKVASQGGKIDYWLALSFADDRSRQLVMFLGAEASEQLIVGFQQKPKWIATESVRQYLQSLNAQQFSLHKLLSLAGPQHSTRLAMRQTQLAIESHVPVLVVGPKGSGKRQLAEAISFHRQRGSEHAEPPTVISCSLIDLGLLRELSELVLQRIIIAKQSKLPMPSILLDRIDLLAEDCVVPLLALVKKSAEASIVSTGIDSWFERSKGSNKQDELLCAVGTLQIALCPMRERVGDIPVLLQQIFQDIAKETNQSVHGVSERVREILRDYAWPGNVTEFVATMKSAIAASGGAEIDTSHLPVSIRSYPSAVIAGELPETLNLEEVLIQTERRLIENAIQRNPNNRAAAARLLGISRTKLFRRMQQLGMNGPEDVAPDVQAISSEELPKQQPQPRKKKTYTSAQMVNLAVEEDDEMPEFQEIPDDE